MEIIYIFAALQLKHFIVDFPLQGPYMYKNKGTWGHPGGILHAGFHGLMTIFCFMFSVPTSVAFMIGLIDFLVHYIIDWSKMNLNRVLGYGPTTHEEFWWLLGLDQFLHQLTYIALIAVFVLK